MWKYKTNLTITVNVESSSSLRHIIPVTIAIRKTRQAAPGIVFREKYNRYKLPKITFTIFQV